MSTITPKKPSKRSPPAHFDHRDRLILALYAQLKAERETREAPRGSEASFGSEADIIGKFRKLSSGVLTDDQQDKLVEAVLSMESLASSNRLMELLSPSQR